MNLEHQLILDTFHEYMDWWEEYVEEVMARKPHGDYTKLLGDIHQASRPLASKHIHRLISAQAYESLYPLFDDLRAFEVQQRTVAKSDYAGEVHSRCLEYLQALQDWIVAREQLGREQTAQDARLRERRDQEIEMRELDLREQELRVRELEAEVRLSELRGQ